MICLFSGYLFADDGLDEFKIVYVAPMKALAAEMTESFSKRLAYMNIKVRELVRCYFIVELDF